MEEKRVIHVPLQFICLRIVQRCLEKFKNLYLHVATIAAELELVGRVLFALQACETIEGTYTLKSLQKVMDSDYTTEMYNQETKNLESFWLDDLVAWTDLIERYPPTVTLAGYKENQFYKGQVETTTKMERITLSTSSYMWLGHSDGKAL